MKNFLRDLMMMPDKDGKRRLVKNKFTGKLTWTKGKTVDGDRVVIDKTLDDKCYDEVFYDAVNNRFAGQYEPVRNNRFVVHFPGIKSYFVRSYSFLGEDRVTDKKTVYNSSIQVLLPIGPSFENDILNSINKNIKTVSIEMLDPTGVVIRTISLENSTIRNVRVYENLAYSDSLNDDFEVMTIEFSHSKRKISE